MAKKLSKFGFGGVGFKVKGNTIMPGNQGMVWGARGLVAPALFAEDLDYEYEFGEIVEITGDTGTNYIVKPIDENTLATAVLGVIMREITGDTTIHAGIITKGIPNVTLNIWPLEKNVGDIAVAVKGATKPAINGEVFVGNGTNGTVAGVAYPAAISGGTIATDLVFKSLANEPTETNALAVRIGRK